MRLLLICSLLTCLVTDVVGQREFVYVQDTVRLNGIKFVYYRNWDTTYESSRKLPAFDTARVVQKISSGMQTIFGENNREEIIATLKMVRTHWCAGSTYWCTGFDVEIIVREAKTGRRLYRVFSESDPGGSKNFYKPEKWFPDPFLEKLLNKLQRRVAKKS